MSVCARARARARVRVCECVYFRVRMCACVCVFAYACICVRVAWVSASVYTCVSYACFLCPMPDLDQCVIE